MVAEKARFPVITVIQLDRIYSGTFDPSNLCKLRRLGGLAEDKTQTISIENGTLRSEPIKEKNKDFRHNSEIWREGFLNYAAVVLFFHGATVPALAPALIGFYLRVEKLGRLFK
jgi:hypothetical protein